MNLTRRSLLGMAAAAPFAMAAPAPAVKLGIDLFSLRSQNWTPFQLLDYSSKLGAKVVHFSEIRFIGGLEPDNLRAVRRYAEERGIEIEIGMRSICPTSKMFDAKAGTAEEQIGRMLDSATLVGSHIVRAVLGSSEDRRPGPIEMHIESTVKVLRNVRSKAQDHNLKIAIENHSGDMQALELKHLIEESGKDFVGVCLDSGNPLWTLEDPHVTLETLYPYVLTSHVRDCAVWRVPEGAAVSWVRMGQGNVGIDDYCRKYAELCPGRALSLESIVTNPRIFAFRDPKFWDAYRDIPAWEFARFLEIAERGKPRPRRTAPARCGKRAAARTRRSGSQHRLHEEVAGAVASRMDDREASSVNATVAKENTHESPSIYPDRGRGPRRRRTRIRRAGRQHKAAARRPDRLRLVRQVRPLPADPGVARGGGLALRRGSAHARRRRRHGVACARRPTRSRAPSATTARCSPRKISTSSWSARPTTGTRCR